MAGAGRTDDKGGQRICRFLEEAAAARLIRTPAAIDAGLTRTDFSNSSKPTQRFIGPDGRFTDRPSDGVRMDQECEQAAIRIAEVETAKMKLDAILAVGGASSQKSWPCRLLRFMRDQDLRVLWLPTDPLLHPEPESPEAARFMRQAIERADALWAKTAAEKNVTARRRAFAKALFDAMTRPAREGGLGLTFFIPDASLPPKKDHPLFSSRLDCVGSQLYASLCKSHGIETTPVQQFTNVHGDDIEHVMVGLRLDPARPSDLTLVSFQPGERQFDLKLKGHATWAPISELELLAYIHLNRAKHLFPDDSGRRGAELRRALRLAPYNYLVHYQLGVWYWNGGKKEEARRHFRESQKLHPTYDRTLKALQTVEAASRPNE